MLKGERIDGYINVKDNVKFLGNVSLIPGALPHRSNVYYLDGNYGSDSNSGKAFNGAFATFEKAFDVMRDRVDWAGTPWANLDVLYVAPGSYDENLTAMPHGCAVIGLGWDMRDGQCGVKIAPTSGSPVDVGSLVNSAFYNIGFLSADTDRAFDSTVLNNCYFENCFFSGAAETVDCTEAFYTSDVTKTTLRKCWFANAAYGMRFEYVDANDKVAYCLIEDCIVTGVGTCGIYTSANLVGPHSYIRGTHVGGGGQTLTTGINDLSHIFEMDWSCVEASTAIGGSGALRGVNGSYGNGVLLT